MAAAALVACSVSAGAETPAAPPTEPEALAYLDDVVGIVRAGDLGRLCDRGVSTCERSLDAAARASAPRTAPRVVASVEVSAVTHPDGSWTSGGRLFTLCGLDGIGRAYVSELLVFREGDRLIGMQPVFWTGTGVEPAGSGVTRGETPGSCPDP